MSDDDSRASTSSSSSSSSNQQTEKETNTPKKKESKVSMSKNSKLLSTSAKRYRTLFFFSIGFLFSELPLAAFGLPPNEDSLNAPHGLCVLKNERRALEALIIFSIAASVFFLIIAHMQLLWLASRISC